MSANARAHRSAPTPEYSTALAALRTGFRGGVLVPEDPTYETARHVFNGMIERHPRVILQPTGPADVIAAVGFARELGLSLAVKAGGHNVAGNAVCDDGVVIDMARMKGIQVDRTERTAWAQAGVLWGEFDRETQLHGLAAPGGRITSTGVAGFTLGGGLGWISRQYGLACDNLLAVDLVTVDGRLIRASAVEHPDLFWGLRGGGGNFGVATSFQFQLHEVGPTIYGGLIGFPGERGAEILEFLARFAAEAPPNLSVLGVLLTAPPVPFLPKESHGKHIVGVAVACNAPAAQAERLVRPLRDLGAPLADLIGPMPYTQLQQMFDPLNPAGQHHYWKSEYLRALEPQAIRTVLTHWESCPSPLSQIHFEFLGGHISAAAEEESACGNRSAPGLVNFVGTWTPPQDAETNIRWVRSIWESMKPHSTGGVYANFLSDESPEMVRAAYQGSRMERLARLKGKYDPGNVLRTNLNIRPALT